MLIAIGTTILAYTGLASYWAGSFNLAHIMLIVAGLLPIGYAFGCEFFEKNAKWVKYFLASGYVVVIGFILFIAIFAGAQKPSYNENVCIVLGCGLKGDNPSIQLRNRLDGAIDYYNQNPDCTIICCGGMGPKETVTEAEAMKKYLVEKGVPADKIIEENESSTTAENFENAKEILSKLCEDGTLPADYSAVYITNAFHVFRSGIIAKKAGLDCKITGLATPSATFFAPVDYMREVAATVKTVLS